MEDIQTLRKPSNIPPVTLEELNDYSEGNKDQWINSRRYGEPLTKADNFKNKGNSIFHLATKLENPKGLKEMIGYIDQVNMVFLPFYKRENRGNPTDKWEDYTTNFKIGGNIKYKFVFDLGLNERAEREAGRSREDEERERRRVEEAIERSNRMMEQMNAQNEGPVRLAEEKRKAQSKERESLNESVNKAPFESIKDNDLGGSHRRKLKQSRRMTRKLKQSRRMTRKLSSRKLSSRKLSSRKLRKSRK